MIILSFDLMFRQQHLENWHPTQKETTCGSNKRDITQGNFFDTAICTSNCGRY